MKRTITLTAEDLQFMENMDAARLIVMFSDLKERLEGKELNSDNSQTPEWKKLDSLTRPVKTSDKNAAEIRKLCAKRLNQLLGTKFIPDSQSMKTHVNARVKEGYTSENFLEVIDKKVAEWGNSDKMRLFLRPQTLFSPNFESYLNQPWVIKGKVSIPAEKAREVDYSEGI